MASGFTYTFGVSTDPGEGYYTTFTYNLEHGLDPAYSALHNASATVWVAQHGTARGLVTFSAWRTCQKCGLDFPESQMIEHDGVWYCQDCFEGVGRQGSAYEYEGGEDDTD